MTSTRVFGDDGTVLWAGGYTADATGTAVGLTPLSTDADGTLTPIGAAAPSPSPSFAVAHPSLPVLYAANEIAAEVSAWRVLGDGRDRLDRLDPLGAPQPAGASACHVAVDRRGRFLVATCWGDGAVLVYDLEADGSFGRRTLAPAAVDLVGDDPDLDPRMREQLAIDSHTGAPRQSRAHASLLLDDSTFVTTDLGFDLLRFWRYAPGGELELTEELPLPAGSGPRHLTRLPDGRILVVTEYSVEVVVVEPADPAGPQRAEPDRPEPERPEPEAADRPAHTPAHRIAAIVPALASGAREGDTASEIALSDDARTLYVSVRGSDRVGVLRVGDDGAIRPLGESPSGGRTPRHHLVAGDRLHIAHQLSNEITTHAIDLESGLLVGIVGRTPIGSPTVVARGPVATSGTEETHGREADASPLLTDDGRAFVTERHLATLSTLLADGSPHVVPVGFTFDGRRVRIITSGESQKVLNVRRDGRASVCQVEGAEWLTLSGAAHIESDAASVADAVERYAARYRQPRENPLRVAIVIEVDRVLGSAKFKAS